MEQMKPVHYPLIVTLDMDEVRQAKFNALRKAHFPAHANYLDAHLTLFHHLPSREPFISETLHSMAMREPFLMEVSGIKHFGPGVLFSIVSEELQGLHKCLQDAFMPWLKRQDQQVLRPHITIQNKVTVFKAACLARELQDGFEPFPVTAIGFRTWYYLGGPWRTAGHFPFQKQ